MSCGCQALKTSQLKYQIGLGCIVASWHFPQGGSYSPLPSAKDYV